MTSLNANSGSRHDDTSKSGQTKAEESELFSGQKTLAMNDSGTDHSSLPARPGEDTSDIVSNTSAATSSLPGYVSSDAASGVSAEFLGHLNSPNIDEDKYPNIEEDTPAAAALRANAEVQVRRAAKLARKIHVQSAKNIVKKVTRQGIGNKRGKPPRIPPHRTEEEDGAIYMVEEESDEEAEVEEEEKEEEKHEDNGAPAREVAFGTVNDGRVSTDVKQSFALIGADHDKVPAEVLTGTLETGKKLLSLSDPHDLISNQRWRLRRKRGAFKQERKSYVKGKVIDGQHELYALSIAVMLGVRTSIGATNHQLMAEKNGRWLTSDDFMATEKYKFKPCGSIKTPPHQLGHTFKFKDYSPLAFAYLRRLFGINEFDFLLSVCGNANFIEFISNAKSGQFFFYSSDGKFMIKTMTNAESEFLRRILPHYFKHCSQNPNTMLTKFLGMYRVKLYHLRRNVKFVIMNSVYYTDKYLQCFYDLKGSVTGRDAKPGQDVRKDNDLRRGLPHEAIVLDSTTRARIRKQIIADCEFMKKMKIMDYSMLIGVHHIPPKGKGIKSDDVGTTGFRFADMRRENMKFRDLLRSSIRDATVAAGHHSAPTLDFKRSERDDEPVMLSSMPTRLTNVGESEASTTSSVDHSGRSVESDSRDDKHFPHLAMYEHGLDDDDDNSYLEGSTKNPLPTVLPEATTSKLEDLEIKKEQTTEQLFWPFHRLYDIHGHRRMIAARCHHCGSNNCSCDGKPDEVAKLYGIELTPFVPPLSDRKDGGLMMDTTGYERPIKFKTATGREHLCEGKIFYMGIIDILQQYNARKRVEARYRRIQGSGWHEASCVHPDVYAERFIQFFDEYSQRHLSDDASLEEGEESVVFSKAEEAKEEVKANT